MKNLFFRFNSFFAELLLNDRIYVIFSQNSKNIHSGAIIRIAIVNLAIIPRRRGVLLCQFLRHWCLLVHLQV